MISGHDKEENFVVTSIFCFKVAKTQDFVIKVVKFFEVSSIFLRSENAGWH